MNHEIKGLLGPILGIIELTLKEYKKIPSLDVLQKLQTEIIIYIESIPEQEIRKILMEKMQQFSFEKHQKSNDKIQRYLALISNSAGSLLHIINDILEISKINAEKIVLDTQLF